MIRLRLLGETAIDVDGTPVGPESQVLFAVLLVLALERGKRVARTALHRLLWPTATDDSGRHNLRQVLYKLRQMGAPVETTQSSVMIPFDVVEGELLELTSGHAAIGARFAAGRRMGELLPGYLPAFSAPFAEWIDEQRGLLQAQLRRSLLAAMGDARASGRWREVEAIAREVLRFDTLNEEATLALAEATALAGAKAQAIGIIDRYLDEMDGGPADLKLPATVLRRRIAERFPAHRYVSAADACFVGRAREMADLLAVWRRAKDRRGGAVLLWGEPGIGKSRLAQELGKVAVLQGAQVQRVASRSWDVQRPLGAIVDLVPSLRELPGAAGIDPRCNEYLDRLTKHDPNRALTDLPDAATLHRQVRQAVFDLIDALLAEAPLVLVFEDVQWLDAASWEVLAELLRLARTRRLLLVLTSRVAAPRQQSECEDWEAMVKLRVDGIDAEATGELLDVITREAGKYVDPEYREWCVPLANGNPLHVQEIALQWLDKGSVREAPRTLRAMLEDRVRRLSDNARLVLRLCALAGDRYRLDWYPRTELLDLRSALDAVAELEGAHLVTARESAIQARHAVIEDVALADISAMSRSCLYRAVASALTSLPEVAEKVDIMWAAAVSWHRSGEPQRAMHLIDNCASHLLHVGLPRDASQLFELGESLACNVEDRARLLSGKVVALAQSGEWRAIFNAMRGMRPARAPSSCAPSGIAMLRFLEARWRHDEDVSPLIEDCCAMVNAPHYDATARLMAATLAAVLSDNRDGCFDEYRSCGRVIASLLTEPSISATERYRHIMIARAVQRDVRGAADAARALTEALAGSNQPFDCSLHRQVAVALRLAGQLDDAETVLRRALERSLGEGRRSDVTQCYIGLAQIGFYRHELDVVGRWCDLATASGECEGNPSARHALDLAIAHHALLAGDLATAEAKAASFGDPLATDDNSRRQLARLTFALRTRVSFARSLDSRDRHMLQALRALLETNQDRGEADFHVATCARALLLDGRTADAVALVQRYLTSYRLERCPVHLELHRVLSEAPFARSRALGQVSDGVAELSVHGKN